MVSVTISWVGNVNKAMIHICKTAVVNPPPPQKMPLTRGYHRCANWRTTGSDFAHFFSLPQRPVFLFHGCAPKPSSRP